MPVSQHSTNMELTAEQRRQKILQSEFKKMQSNAIIVGECGGKSFKYYSHVLLSESSALGSTNVFHLQITSLNQSSRAISLPTSFPFFSSRGTESGRDNESDVECVTLLCSVTRSGGGGGVCVQSSSLSHTLSLTHSPVNLRPQGCFVRQSSLFLKPPDAEDNGT